MRTGLTTSLHCWATFPSHKVRVIISPCRSMRMARVCRNSNLNSSTDRSSDSTAFAFVIAFIALATSSSMDSVPRVLTTDYCGSLLGMSGSSMSDLTWERMIPTFREYTLYPAIVSLSRHGYTAIQPPLSSLAGPIMCA